MYIRHCMYVCMYVHTSMYTLKIVYLAHRQTNVLGAVHIEAVS